MKEWTWAQRDCQKCGGRDIGTRYHAQGCSDPDCSCATCAYSNHAKQHTEHLHRFCRGCGFDWAAPVLAKPIRAP